MSESKTTQSGGIGFCGLLTIVFITLKLTGFIDWSWWWVTAPLWGVFVLVIAIIAIVFIYALIADSLARRKNSRARRG